jgi:hypothetical protein
VRIALISAALFVASAMIGSWYVPYVVAHGGKPSFYQEQFGAAAMLACGRGYLNPDVRQAPALDAFLSVKADAVACGDLPAGGTLPLTSMQTAFRYLMSTVALTWRTEGRVTWSGLTPLYGVLYGATVTLAFLVFLQGMSVPVAALAAVALAISPLHMGYLAHLRDYAKAPFVLAIVLLAILCVRGAPTARRLVGLAAAAGIVTGIGVGFRNDLLVAVPAFVVLLFVFTPFGLRERVALKAASAAAYLTLFLVALSPMLTIYQTGGGNSSQHLILLGLSDRFTDDLGIDNGHLYGWGYDYKDELAHAMISGYADHRLGRHGYLAMYGADYDRAGTALVRDIALNFPADMLVRVYASALRILTLPYSGTAVQQPAFLEPSRLSAAYGARTWLLRQIAPLWPWTIVFTLGALTVAHPRFGLFGAALVMYLSGYPALQFHERHFFHLEFIALWAFGFTVSQLTTALLAARDTRTRAGWVASITPVRGWGRSLGVAAAAWAAIGAALLLPLAGARMYQQRHVRNLFERYLSAPRDPLPATRAAETDGVVIVDGASPTVSDGASGPDDGVHSTYLRAAFGGPTCSIARMDVTFRYNATEAQHDFSRTIAVQPTAPGPTVFFFPAYEHRSRDVEAIHSGYALAGIEMPSAGADCLTEVSRVRDPSALPLLMELRLPPRWRDATLYGTLAGIETRSNGDATAPILTFPENLIVRRSVLVAPITPIDPSSVRKESGRVDVDGAAWHLSGVGGRGRFLNLFETPTADVMKGATLVASGRLTRGGISLGLVRDGAWAAQVPITALGAFTVVIQAPAPGRYAVVVTNYVLGASLRYEASFDRLGWITDVH